MEIVLDFACRFFEFLSDLYLFFFTPLPDLLSIICTRFVGLEDSVLEKVLSAMFNLAPILRGFTLVEFLLGAGILLFLVIRLITHMLPLAE